MSMTLALPQHLVDVYDNYSLEELLCEFKRLTNHTETQDQETRKLIILKRVERHLDNQFYNPIVPIPVANQQSNKTYEAILKLAYQFCMVFGFFEKAAGSFLFGSNLFAIIPGINHFSLYALTFVYTLIDALLFYAFEVSFLKKALGVVFADNGACLLNKTYIEQLKSVEVINEILRSADTLDWAQGTRATYRECVAVFNAHLLEKHERIGCYQQTSFRMGVEYGVALFGGLTSIADSYFMAKNALLLLHLSFASSPLGSFLVVCMVVSALVFYYAMNVKSMSDAVNPDRKSYYALKEGLSMFHNNFRKRQPPYIPRAIPELLVPAHQSTMWFR